MKRMSAFCAVVVSMLLTTPAQAAAVTVNGYVCSAAYTRHDNVFYGQGHVQVRVHSAPGCTGSVVGTYIYLGTGASSAGVQHSEAEKLQLFERATQAATQGTRVNLTVDNTNNVISMTTYYAQ